MTGVARLLLDLVKTERKFEIQRAPQVMPNEPYKPRIFISYSHVDEPETPRGDETKWLTFVTSYLRPALKQGKRKAEATSSEEDSRRILKQYLQVLLSGISYLLIPGLDQAVSLEAIWTRPSFVLDEQGAMPLHWRTEQLQSKLPLGLARPHSRRSWPYR